MTESAYWEDVAEGEEIPRLLKKATPQQLVMWAAASGDFYQIHYDEHFARANGLQDIIVHGALKAAFLGQTLHDWAGAEGCIKRFACSYRGRDYTGQEIVCRGVITRKYEQDGEHLVDLRIWTETGKADDDERPKNPEGIETTTGTATIVLSSRNESRGRHTAYGN